MGRFNEAAALPLRKRGPGGAAWLRCTCFNEAAALPLRKRKALRSVARRQTSFNEAAALPLRKPGRFIKAGELLGKLQ